MIDVKSDERQNINRILIEADNHIDISNKEKAKNELKIKELKKINEERSFNHNKVSLKITLDFN